MGNNTVKQQYGVAAAAILFKKSQVCWNIWGGKKKWDVF